MNKYIIPICDIDAGQIWTETIIAKSSLACQDKLMEKLIDYYNIENDFPDYREFVTAMDSEYNILVGDIIDIEEL